MTDTCTLIIFGATGNLAQIKLLPSLFHLERAGLLTPAMRIVCSGRKDFTSDSWRQYVRKVLAEHARDPLTAAHCDDFCDRMHYLRGDLGDDDTLSLIHI